MASFKKTGSLGDLQQFIAEVYAVPDDRLYSIWDLLTQEQRFAMRSLKGIRKGDMKKLRINLLIALSWIMAIGNRLHIDLEDETWRRFPGLCSYCGKQPCICHETKPESRLSTMGNAGPRPTSLQDMQVMFQKIYPAGNRTLADAGVHLAEEVGEVSEAIHIADFISCIFGVANSANMNMAEALRTMYANNCHVCHESPCSCKFSDVAHLNT